MCVCFLSRTTLHIQSWLLTSTGVSHRCPLFTATTQHPALRRSTPQRIQRVRTWKGNNRPCLFQIESCFLFIVMFTTGVFVSVSGSHRNVSGGSQTGDTLGKALASVSMPHLNPVWRAHLCPIMFKTARLEHKTKPWKPQRCNAQREHSCSPLPVTD